jgi:hypothetical protein
MPGSIERREDDGEIAVVPVEPELLRRLGHGERVTVVRTGAPPRDRGKVRVRLVAAGFRAGMKESSAVTREG